MTSLRIRSLSWIATAVIAAAAGLAATGGPAAAAEQEVVDGYLTWGFNASFRQYVSTGNGQPPISATGGATVNPDGTFRFPVSGGTFDRASRTGTVHYSGTVVFSYPAHFFEITMSNPTLVAGANGVRLLADVVLTSDGGFDPVNATQAELAALTGPAPTVDGDTVSWSGLSATLTDEGATVFAGFYEAGHALDPVSTVFSSDGSVAVPTVTVTPATGLDPDGATIEVVGSGFNPTSPGIYLVFGPKRDGQWWTDSSLFQVAMWVYPGGGASPNTVRLEPDGSFRTTLDVRATYTDGHGEDVDCRAVTCYVTTMRAHAQPDRSQDTFTPVSFGSTGGGGGTARQEITVEVTGGPLTLTVAGDTVGLTSTTIGGTATGRLNPATVEDLRGTSAGWSLVGQVSDFTTDGGAFSGNQLGWTPHATANGGGTVTPGGPVPAGLGAAHTLCSAPTGSGGGSFTCGADLTLRVPATAVPGAYRATLTLTLS